MIGPVTTSQIGAPRQVRLAPSSVEVPGEKRAPGVAAELTANAQPRDEARVAELRQAIAEGRYVVDSAKLAQAMIDADLTAK